MAASAATSTVPQARGFFGRIADSASSHAVSKSVIRFWAAAKSPVLAMDWTSATIVLRLDRSPRLAADGGGGAKYIWKPAKATTGNATSTTASRNCFIGLLREKPRGEGLLAPMGSIAVGL